MAEAKKKSEPDNVSKSLFDVKDKLETVADDIYKVLGTAKKDPDNIRFGISQALSSLHKMVSDVELQVISAINQIAELELTKNKTV